MNKPNGYKALVEKFKELMPELAGGIIGYYGMGWTKQKSKRVGINLAGKRFVLFSWVDDECWSIMIANGEAKEMYNLFDEMNIALLTEERNDI
jgi:hypothetical protein